MTMKQMRLPGMLEPALAHRACKDEICPPGEFASVPLALLARKDMSPCALKVYILMLNGLRGASQWADIPVRELIRRTGYERKSVLKAIWWLVRHRFIERRKMPDGRYLTAFAPPEDWLPEETEDTVAFCNSTPQRSTGVRRSGVQVYSVEEYRCTPQRSTPIIKDLKKLTNTQSARDATIAKCNSVIQDIADAYRQVFGTSPPAKWNDQVKRELQEGVGRELLARIDAGLIRQAAELAAKKGGTFGFGWVIKSLQQQSRRRKVSALPVHEPGGTIQHLQTLRARQKQLKMQEHFNSLPPEVQNQFIQRAKSRYRRIRDPAALKAVAVGMAWTARTRRDDRNINIES